MRMPMFTWMAFVVQFLLVLAFPVITIALVFLQFDRFFGTNFYTIDRRRRPAALAAPVLDLRTPGGLHPDPAGVRPGVGDPADVLAQAALRLPGDGLLGNPHRLPRLRRVGAPHVRRRHGPDRRLGVRRDDDAHRDPDRREDLQLDLHDVGRQPAVHDGDEVRDLARGAVHHRRHLGRHARVAAGRPAADRHLLHRRALPLRALRRLDDGALRRHLLLLPEDHRPPAEREARQLALLADVHRREPDVLPDALVRAARHAAPHLHVRRRPGLGDLQPDEHRRRVPAGDRRAASSSTTSSAAASSGEIAGNDPWGAPTLEWSIPSPPPEYNFAAIPTRDVALSAVGREVARAHRRRSAQPARRRAQRRRRRRASTSARSTIT